MTTATRPRHCECAAYRVGVTREERSNAPRQERAERDDRELVGAAPTRSN